MTVIEFTMSDSELEELHRLSFIFSVSASNSLFRFKYAKDKYNNTYKLYEFRDTVNWFHCDEISKITSIKKVLDRYIKLKIICQ